MLELTSRAEEKAEDGEQYGTALVHVAETNTAELRVDEDKSAIY